ncbi:hypothetical protein DSO57_1001348 [Entomophthora muscae]|uniref:Uncharacterized protein n=2 Tax=Entomophthora muscae TaxID=34485 RepID=A0ACC2SY41_9FUNG|nr:hypothetical protein DSO57_1001346 [Entomophthora muscae]KAJ9067235.1 hypothetical protein DSO57_1001348 [Entomophthora muscae]
MYGQEHYAFRWVYASGGDIPENAIVGGCEDDGTPLFVARHSYGGSLVIGKAAPHLNGMNFGFGGDEHHTHEYEVLIGDIRMVRWVPYSGCLTHCEYTPLKAGHEPNGQELFIAKARRGPGEVVGKVSTDMSNGMVYTYAGEERSIEYNETYYVLCIN